MPYSAQVLAEEAKVAELKRLIKSRRFDSLEVLEDAVDAFLWGTESPLSPDPGLAAESRPAAASERMSGQPDAQIA